MCDSLSKEFIIVPPLWLNGGFFSTVVSMAGEAALNVRFRPASAQQVCLECSSGYASATRTTLTCNVWLFFISGVNAQAPTRPQEFFGVVGCCLLREWDPYSCQLELNAAGIKEDVPSVCLKKRENWKCTACARQALAVDTVPEVNLQWHQSQSKYGLCTFDLRGNEKSRSSRSLWTSSQPLLVTLHSMNWHFVTVFCLGAVSLSSIIPCCKDMLAPPHSSVPLVKQHPLLLSQQNLKKQTKKPTMYT